MSLQLRDIVLTYPDGGRRLTAVDHASLGVPAGSVTALVGPSGSGKSSLLAVAAALITPDAGEVTVDGASLAGMSRAEKTTLRRERIGMVFQQPNLIASLTAVEQLELMAHLNGQSPRTAGRRARELLEAVGLADKLGKRPHELSGGQQQRVNIARALAADPAVLLVDEPTSALDHERGAAIIDLLTTLTYQRATATVLVTHDQSHLDGVDQAAWIVDGRLSAGQPALSET
jgi:putative ABC transport system ATP-binding protein